MTADELLEHLTKIASREGFELAKLQKSVRGGRYLELHRRVPPPKARLFPYQQDNWDSWKEVEK